MSELALQLIAENKRTKDTFLNLGGCNLIELPNELFDCIWLENLSIGGWYFDENEKSWRINQGNKNQIISLEAIERLINLRVLTADENKISDISPLKKLNKLTELNLRDNLISDVYPLCNLVNLIRLNLQSNQIQDISCFRDLKKLRGLYASGNQIQDIYSLVNLENIYELALWGNQISDIKPLYKLTYLENLQIDTNKISNISPLQSLINLSQLGLSNNQINDISYLSSLKRLKVLRLHNNLIYDIASIKDLSQLISLSLSENQILDFSPISKLNQLNILDIRKSKISNIHFLSNLRHLYHLYVSENQISDITPLENLSALSSLYLDSNQIRDIKSLENLNNLSILDIHSNQISNIKVLKQLKTVESLDLSSNLIREITYLEGLNNLKSLNLNDNKIDNIKSLRKLKSLEYLYLSYNSVKDISYDFLTDLPNLTNLSLLDNLIKNIPSEIFGQQQHHNCLPALKDYLQSIENKDFQKELNEAKLTIVGVGEVGKSELVEALSEPAYTFVEGRETTKGIRIKSWTLEACQKQEKIIDFKTNIWDFAGQEINYGTHQFFLTKNSIYVFVWETRKGEEESKFAYWLSVVSLLSENAPIFVVQNKTDIYSSEINQADWKNKFPNIVGFYQTSCKNGIGIANLRTDIQKALLALPHTFEIWNKDRYAIRESLEQSTENYISHRAYLTICGEKQLTKEQAGFLSKQLHDIGVILHYPDEISLKDTVVLKPQWATQAAYCLLLDEKHINKGKFSTTDLENIWADEQFDEKHTFLLGLMKKFELIFQFQESEFYIVPERLSVEQPPILPQPNPSPTGRDFTLIPLSFGEGQGVGQKGKHLRFEYHYDFMPKGIISRFICRMHELIKEELFWKYGVVLKYESSEAVVISSEVNKQIRIEVIGKEADKLLAIIRRDFEAIHEKLRNPKLTEKVPCVCEECKQSENPYFHKYEVLLRFREKGKDTKECEKSGVDVPISALLEGILDTQRVNKEYLLNLIDEIQIPEFYQALDRLGVSSYEVSRLQKEFIYNGGSFQYADQLKVWVMHYFRERGRF